MEGRTECDHVAEGVAVAGFVEVQVNGRLTDGTIVGLGKGAGTVLVDLCLACLGHAREGAIGVHYNHDRRGSTRLITPRLAIGAD